MLNKRIYYKSRYKNDGKNTDYYEHPVSMIRDIKMALHMDVYMD